MSDELTLAAKRELWRRGELSWKLHADQLSVDAAINARSASREVLEIARKWGKTWYLVYRQQTVLDRSPPGSRYVYGSCTYKSLLEFVLPVLDEFYADCPEELRPTYNEKTCHLERPDGSWTHFFGADDKGSADRGRGPKAVEGAFDEAGFCPVLGYVVESVFTPSMLLSGDGKIILSSSPAEQPDHDFTRMAEIAEANGSYARRSIYNNPMLSPERIEKFIEGNAKDRGMSVEEYVKTSEFQREYMAKRVVDKLLVVMGEDWELSEARAVVERERPEFFDAYGVLDMGGEDPHAHLFGYLDFARNCFYVEDELLMRDGENTDRIAELVKAKEAALYGVGRWDGKVRAKLEGAQLAAVPDWMRGAVGHTEAAGQPYLRVADNDVQMIRDLYDLHGLVYVPTQKDEKVLQVNNFRVMVRRGQFEFHPRVKHTIRHLRTTIWSNVHRTTYARKNREHGDLLDCCVYLGRNIHWTHNPAPVGRGPKVGTPEWHDAEKRRTTAWLEAQEAMAEAEIRERKQERESHGKYMDNDIWSY